MGSSTWSSDAYSKLKADYSTKTREEVFSSRKMSEEMSPLGIKFRESRDSEPHPESLAINIFLDVTGSMGHIPEVLLKEKLGALIETLIKHGIPHPAVLFGAIGDHRVDNAPLQIGQFESGTDELNKWLTETYLEAAGGDAPESYGLAHIFAGNFTSIDCFEKRKQKGFLFTVGDERPHEIYEGEFLSRIFGSGYQKGENIDIRDAIEKAKNFYHVIHIVIKERANPDVVGVWKELLGQNVVQLDDFTVLAEAIATTVALYSGSDLKTVTSDFKKGIADKVSNALATISNSIIPVSKSEDGVVHL